MAVKSNIAQFAYAKALIVFALAAWLAASGTAAESRPEDGRRSSQALSAAHTSALIKRMLRSQEVMTMADHTSISEERVTFSEIGISLEQTLTKIKEMIQGWWKRLRQPMNRTPTETPEITESGTGNPKILESGTIKSEILERNPDTFESGTIKPEESESWARLVQLIHTEPSKETAEIFKMLDHEISDVSLVYMIYKTIESAKSDKTSEVMVDLRNAQFKKWLKQEATPEGVKSMLQAATKSDSPARKIFDRIAKDYDKFYGKVKVGVEDPSTSDETMKLNL
ncbi:hypothetical protein KXD40_001159 [Peronospora effusa]|nr:hypothetical protein KXD40_001159 [Peronospora effusa]